MHNIILAINIAYGIPSATIITDNTNMASHLQTIKDITSMEWQFDRHTSNYSTVQQYLVQVT